MKKFYCVFLTLISIIFFIHSSFAQSCSANVEVINYCEDQYAEFIIHETDKNANYYWYSAETGGTEYGIYNESFSSETTLPGGSGAISYWYSKSIDAIEGPSTPNHSANKGLNMTGTAFHWFNAKTDITLHSVTFVAQIDNLDPSKTYKISVKIQQGAFSEQSQTYEISGSELQMQSIGGSNYYTIEIPVNITIPQGDNYSLSLADRSPEINYALYPLSEFSYPIDDEFIYFEEPSFQDAGTNYALPFFDWDISANCPRVKVTSNEENSAFNCCTPVDIPVELSLTSKYVVTPFSDALQAVGGSDLYYKWYYEGEEISGAEGTGTAQYLNIDKLGKYKVRVVRNKNYIDRKSCYKETEIEIIEKKLFASDNIDLCLGETAELEVSGAIGPVIWTPNNAIDDVTSLTPTIQPEQDIIYTVSADVYGGPGIPNGSFDSPTLDFDSDYTSALSTGGITFQKFVIGNKVVNTAPEGIDSWEECEARDGNGGYFMWLDGATVPNQNIVKHTVQVTKNKDYDFSMWIANIVYKDGMAKDVTNPGNAPAIQVFINDQPVGGLYQHNGNVCEWKEHSFTWNSGNSTDATIRVVEMTNSNYENDFAIDDISFGFIETQTDEVIVSVDNCLELTVSEDTTICIGDSAQLRATTNGLFMNWKPEEIFPAQWSNTQYVKPEIETTYSVETAYKLGNLIVNGDFEQGLTQATKNNTDYNAIEIPNNNVFTGAFTVGTDPFVANNYFRTIGDHTSGTGNMFIADGSSDITFTNVYFTDVVVEAGQKYAFSAWIANIHQQFNNPAELSFYINNEKLGELDALEGTDDWTNVYYIWEATKDEVVRISIQNENNNPNGNDFALDDLEFSPLSPHTVTKEITISVDKCLPPVSDFEITLCEEANNSVTNIDITPYADSIKNFEEDNTIYWFTNAARTDTLKTLSNLTVDGPQTIFYARVYSKTGIDYNDAQLTYIVNPLPIIEFPEMPTICLNADPISLEGTLPEGGVYKGKSIQGDNIFTPNVKGTNNLTYEVTDANGCFSSADTSIEVHVPETITFIQPEDICADVPNIDINPLVSPVTGVSGNGEFAGESVSANGNFTHTGSGKYDVTYIFTNTFGCVDSAIKTITVHEMPTADIIPDTNGICVSSSIVMDGNPTGGNAPYTHNWVTSGGELSSTKIQTPEFTSDIAGNIELRYTVTDSKGCIAESSFILQVMYPPEVKIVDIAPLCAYEDEISINVAVAPEGGTGIFSGNIITSDGKFNPQKAVVVSNTITYTYTDPYGCTNSDEYTVIVNPKPDLSLQSKNYACINDEPFSISPNLEGGSFSGSAVDKYGVFTPLQGKEGNNDVTYYYIDPVTGCENSKSKKITLHPLPKPNFNSKDIFCDYDDAIEIQLTPFEKGSSILSGNGASTTNGGGLFDPAEAGEGQHDITYAYTTEFGCTDSITKTYTVNHTDVPITHDGFGLITARSVEIDNISATITEDGAELIWYDSKGTKEISRKNPYNTGIEEIGSFRFYARQYLNGCYSDTVPTLLTIVECTAPVPDVLNDSICEGEAIKPIAAVHDTDFEIGWFTSPSTEAKPFWTEAEYLPSNASLGRNNYWVAHYNTERDCWSAPAKVVFTIHENPDVDIADVNSQYCDFDNEFTPYYSHEGGTLYINGTETKMRSFDPSVLGEGDYDLRYEYTDEKTGCSNEDNLSFSIFHTDPPYGEDKTHQNRYMSTLPDLVAEGINIQWYKDEISTNFLDNGNNYATGITDTAVRTYTFYPTQTINGCESEPYPIRLHIVRCPTPAPIAEGYDICVYDNIEGLTAREASLWPEPATGNGKMFWFSSLQSNGLNDTISNKLHSGNNPFVPSLSGKGTYTFYVAEWDHNCLSPKTPVTIEIKETPEPTISATNVCQFGRGNTIWSNEYNTYWFPTASFAQTALAMGDIFSFSTDVSDSLTYYGSLLKDGCFSTPVPATVEIIAIPQPPFIPKDTVEICEGSVPTHSLQATTYGGQNVAWFNSQETQLPSGTVQLSSLRPGKVYEFKVKHDTLDLGCWSDFAHLYIDYISTPDRPEIINPDSYCLGDEIKPVLIDPLYLEMNTITELNWYDINDNFLTSGFLYLPEEVNQAQTIEFKAQAINRDCPSEMLDASLKVKLVPAVSIKGPDSVCVLDGERLYEIENGKSEYGYYWHLSSETSSIKPVMVEQGNGGFNILVEWVGQGVDSLYCETSYDGCTSFDTIIVYISDYPKAGFEYDVKGNSGYVEFLNTSDPTMTVTDHDIIIEQDNHSTWYFYTSNSDTIIYPENKEDIVNNKQFTQYGFTYGDNLAYLKVTNDFGCSVYRSESFFIDIFTSLFVPNCFAPEGPNNDIKHFRPKGINLEKYEITIYDVWGNQLWYSNKLSHTQPAEAWDGMYQGKPLKADSYIWKIEATFKNGKTWQGAPTKKGGYTNMGTVNLIR